ncbi:hypothetical protein [Actinoplanes aureus]|uniref:Uncharacterized protein n=1 Tax=Actinoplanes aureus TaxID=2792083 RepID=A0A931CB41_9ACTN|nr:hypothetical protein [Actinoplanes aureus]MBG0565444.1 hypothetical protein [Actinoplanes aureus]
METLLRVVRPVLVIALIFASVSVFEMARGSTTAAVLVAVDGALITAYAIGRQVAKVRLAGCTKSAPR